MRKHFRLYRGVRWCYSGAVQSKGSIQGRPRGICSYDSRMAHHAVWLAEHLVGPDRIGRWVQPWKTRIRAQVLSSLRRRGLGTRRSVERRTDLSPHEFQTEYLNRNEPVILEGAARNWPATQQWSLAWLSENYGDMPLTITDYGDESAIDLRTAVERIDSGDTVPGRCGPLLHRYPELRDDLRLSELGAYRAPAVPVTSFQFFLGGAGSHTPLHAGATNNLSVQLEGEKKWLFVDPVFNPALRPVAYGGPHFMSSLDLTLGDDDSVPEIQYLDVMEATVKAGDVLFVPSLLWHCVSHVTPSITVGTRWFSMRSALRASPIMVALMATATRPTAFGAAFGARAGKTAGFYS